MSPKLLRQGTELGLIRLRVGEFGGGEDAKSWRVGRDGCGLGSRTWRNDAIFGSSRND